MNVAYRLARRIAISIVGFTVLAVGDDGAAWSAFIGDHIGLGILGLEVRMGAALVADGEGASQAVAKTVTGSGSSSTPKSS